MRASSGLLAGLSILALLAGLALIAPLLPRSPNALDLGALSSPPSAAHPMGTDPSGRDVATRVAYGARVSLAVGFLTAGLSLMIGVPLGALAGYRGGWADVLVGRAVEAMLVIPSILFALALLAAAPPWLSALPETLRVALVLAAGGWTSATRFLRAEFLRLRGADMVAAARAAGASEARIIVLHILPSTLAPVLVTGAFAVAGAMLLEAALSFLGLGVAPPTATWGGILREAASRVRTDWWMALFPGLCLFLAVLGCNLTGEGLRDYFDPRTTWR